MKTFLSVLCVCFVLCPFFVLPLSAAPNLEYYLGAPYIKNPLGDGGTSPYTPGPLWREDGFDCTTYVEAVLSQRKQKVQQIDFQKAVLSLRYVDGEVGFFSRAHLMEYHWIPNAVRQHFIAPYPLQGAKFSAFRLNLQEWFFENPQAVHKDAVYHSFVSAQPSIAEASIPYIPAQRLTSDLLETLPDFMVVFFLKEIPDGSWHGQKGRQHLITHMGMLVDRQLYHASSRRKKVVKVDLLDYVRSSQSIVGVSFYRAL